jgi:hypothetical protein
VFDRSTPQPAGPTAIAADLDQPPPWFGLERPRRVVYLVIAVVLMSLADLAITLTWVTDVGLAESNPLARWVIAQGSPALLSVWKLITIVPAVLVFLALRHKPIAEAGAFVACVLLGIVTLHWYAYHDTVNDLSTALPMLEAGMDHRWIALADN